MRDDICKYQQRAVRFVFDSNFSLVLCGFIVVPWVIGVVETLGRADLPIRAE